MLEALIVAAAVFVPIAFGALALLAFRWWSRRDKRRAPFQDKLHHVAGQQLRERITEHDDEMLMAYMLIVLSGPLLALTWALHYVAWKRIHFGFFEVFTIVAAVAIFGMGLRSFIRHARQRRHARDGLAAEQMTAQQLNRLIGEGCQALHDVPGEGFNLDHVVIGPRGVFMVETKSFRKPVRVGDDTDYKVRYDGSRLVFRNWSTSKPIKQARNQADWLARYLRSAVGPNIPVIPAVALPGWWIEHEKSPGQSDVRVFSPKGRGAQFMLSNDFGAPIGDDRRNLVAQALAMRYPETK